MVDLAPQAAVQAEAAARPSIRRYYVLALVDRRLCAELPRPHHLQRPDRADQKGICAQRHHDGPARGLRLRAVLFAARHPDRAPRRPLQPPQHRGGRAGVLERDDGLLRHGAKRGDAGAGAHRRRHRQIRRHAGLAIDHCRPLQQERTPARARRLRHRHLSRRVPRLFHRRLYQPVLRLAHGVLYRRPARHRARRGAVADDFRTEARRDGGDVHAGADRPDARLPRLATDVRHFARQAFA